MTEEAIRRILNEVIEQIRPDEEERKRVKAVTDLIIARLNQKAIEMGIAAHAISVGSTARNTWLRGEADIDIFIMFPPSTSEEELKELGLRLAKSVADRYEERYASHPYIHAYFSEPTGLAAHEADLVPCFEVEDPSQLKSAVDRTPFHNRYIVKRIGGLEDDVLLLKQFMKYLGIYGSEQRRKGFAGYLCELLILKYSSFIGLLRHAAQWSYGEWIDLEGKGTYKADGREPLIVIDPVDPRRNVAASVSSYSFCRLIDAAREFLSNPSREYFVSRKEPPLSEMEFKQLVESRGTEIVMVLFDAPDLVEDILFPQLRKAEASVTTLLERHGFTVYRSDVSVDDGKAFLLFELLVWRLPRIKKHFGPPVTSAYHAEKFKRKYTASPLFIEQGRYVVEVERRYTDAVGLLQNELRFCSLGKQVAEAINRGYEVLRTADIHFFGELGSFFRDYFRGIRSPSRSPL